MAYKSIASKYRSKTFSDLVGQESICLALMGSITQSRIPSGIIFSGTRGVGKTSLARIYARALNCEDKSSSEPCGTCSSCVAIAEGHHEDVVEIDGASNNGVDEVRALRESTAYVPQRSPYRIYIIDEVHMLSISAFNALLKTLEEPPSHVVFLFATTELGKLPQTVVSRCQLFRLQKISLKNIEARIKFVLEQEGVTWEEGLLPILAREGRGSLRDALTFLDQLIAISGFHLTRASLEKILGDLSESSYLSLLEALLRRDSQEILSQIAAFDDRAESFVRVVNHLALLTRHAFVLQSLKEGDLKDQFSELEEADLLFLKRLAEQHKLSDFNALFKKLVLSLDELRDSFLDRYILENLSLEWCLESPVVKSLSKPDVKKEVQSFPDQVSMKKEEVSKPSRRVEELAPPVKKEEEPLPSSDSPEPSKSPQSHDSSFPSSWKELVARWKQIKPLQARKLEEVVPYEYSEEKIILLVDEDSLVGPTFLRDETRKKVAIVLSKLFNFKGELVVQSQKKFKKPQEMDEGKESFSPPESLLDEKTRLQELQKREKEKSLLEHELTKGLCEKFNGKIVETFVDLS